MKWSTERKTKTGVGITLLVLIVNAGFSYRATRTLIESEGEVSRSYKAIGQLDAALSTMRDAENGARGYLITGDESLLAPFQTAASDAEAHIESLRETSGETLREAIPDLERKLQDAVTGIRQAVELQRAGDPEGARRFVEAGAGKRKVDDFRQFVGTLKSGEEELLQQRTAALRSSGRAAILTFPIDTLIACALLVLVSYLVVHDLRARRVADEALRQQRQWLEVTLSSIGDGVIATDTWGRVTFLNPVAETLTGWPRADAEGKPLETVFHIVNEETREIVENPALRAMRTGTIVGLANHTVLVARNAREISIDDSGAPIASAEGVTLGAVLIFRDITERRRAERERAQLLASEKTARERAEAASRAKDEFVAMISHEVRTPLNAILGWAQLLRAGRLQEAEASRAVDAIERNARTQAQLIEDLLDISKIITGKLSLDVHPVDLRQVLEASVDSLRPAIEAKSIRLVLRLETAGCVVAGDGNRLQQVGWNLLANAVKFTPREGRIEVRLDRVDSQVRFSVADSGSGIDAAFLPYVFDRFSQASTNSERKHGGLGLGLAIVRHLVELHGGTVRAQSPGDGRGATFTVLLPARAAPVDDAPLRGFGPMDEPASPADVVSLEGLRVLIVDDEPDARELIATMLGQYGADVRAADTAAAALSAAAGWEPDVIVSDIGLPREDGYSLIRRIRGHDMEGVRSIPAVALTAYARSDDRMRALAAGFQMHVAKPVEGAELIMVVASLAGRTGRHAIA